MNDKTARQEVINNIQRSDTRALETGIALACVGIYDLTQAYVKSLETANKALEELQKR